MRLLTCFLALGSLATAPALAQTTAADWRPFRVGHTYTFERNTAPVQLETIRLAAGRLNGADSVYAFASFYRPVTAQDSFPASCLGGGFALFRKEPNTPVGAELLIPANATDYRLLFTDSTACRLPRRPAAIGTSWPLTPSVTATVTRLEVRAIGTSTNLDSVMVAALSTGGQLVLSKSFGLLDCPDLRSVAASQASPFDLHLLTIPERALGELPNNTSIDWQPGDSVLWYESGISICESGWRLTRYLSRQISPAGDSVYYRGTTQAVTVDYGSGCSSGRRVTVYPLQSFTQRFFVGSARATPGELLRQVLVSPPPGPGQGYVSRGAYYQPPNGTGCFGGWRFQYSAYFAADSCRNTLDGTLDFGRTYETQIGFGTFSTAGVWGDQGQVVWYCHGNQTCGDRRGFSASLLATPALLPAESVQLYPNPAASAARLHLTGTKGGLLDLTATDALGRRVWRQTQPVGPEAEIEMPVSEWAPGVYYVRVALPEGARTVRLVRE